jgi:hypothetical protein
MDNINYGLYQKYKQKYLRLLRGGANTTISKFPKILNNLSGRKQLVVHLTQIDSKLSNNDELFSQVNLTNQLNQIIKQLDPEQFQNYYQIFQKYIDYTQYPNILRYLTMITSDGQIRRLKLLIVNHGNNSFRGGSHGVESILNGIIIIFILSLITY